MVVIFDLIISRIALYYKRVKSECLPSCFGSPFYGAERAKIPFLGGLMEWPPEIKTPNSFVSTKSTCQLFVFAVEGCGAKIRDPKIGLIYLMQL